MKIALLHMDFCSGPEAVNINKIERAIQTAAYKGASWVVTPETALQGYFFHSPEEPGVVEVQPSPTAQPLLRAAQRHGITLFLSCAERDSKTKIAHNCCMVIGSKGELLGRHRKMHTHGAGSESYLTTGTESKPVECQGVMVGILICADIWFTEHSEDLGKQGAQIILAPAAWPPHPNLGPADSWERSSLASGVPLCVCNQTGVHDTLDLTSAESAVVIHGEKKHVYSGAQSAILIFEWDFDKQVLLSDEFEVVYIEENETVGL